ncbi:hypothetical protein [Limimaricola litoreus]|uniref:Uncharacterized protein n=1 Tax=Limimaricola litoreus TaxID=2955316 RepID=A0A9X2FN62_9RHOB|nr:hypothetical protein [Limimaricola litoreus]MCP1167717.1 hypothetical protein [Limimaricola litoreus]
MQHYLDGFRFNLGRAALSATKNFSCLPLGITWKINPEISEPEAHSGSALMHDLQNVLFCESLIY